MEKLTAEQYREMAAGERRSKEDSFDRCDTENVFDYLKSILTGTK